MISSTSNSQVKNLILLLNKPKARREQDVFVVEGIKMFLETPVDRLVKIYVSEKFISNPSGRESLDGFSYEVIRDDIFRHVSDTVNPQGILAVVKRKETGIDEIIKSKGKNTFLILENLQDPGNLGTIMRTAEGAGVSGIIMAGNTVDIYNPKVIRSTMGATYRVPFMYTNDTEDVIMKLKKNNVVVAAAHLKGKRNYFNEDFNRSVAFIIGNESNGISDKTADMADLLVKIPMEGMVESLNASVAASLLMYEAYRQKNA